VCENSSASRRLDKLAADPMDAEASTEDDLYDEEESEEEEEESPSFRPLRFRLPHLRRRAVFWTQQESCDRAKAIFDGSDDLMDAHVQLDFHDSAGTSTDDDVCEGEQIPSSQPLQLRPPCLRHRAVSWTRRESHDRAKAIFGGSDDCMQALAQWAGCDLAEVSTEDDATDEEDQIPSSRPLRLRPPCLRHRAVSWTQQESHARAEAIFGGSDDRRQALAQWAGCDLAEVSTRDDTTDEELADFRPRQSLEPRPRLRAVSWTPQESFARAKAIREDSTEDDDSEEETVGFRPRQLQLRQPRARLRAVSWTPEESCELAKAIFDSSHHCRDSLDRSAKISTESGACNGSLRKIRAQTSHI